VSIHTAAGMITICVWQTFYEGPLGHVAKEYYTHHNNMLVHNVLAAVIYVKSLNYSEYLTRLTIVTT